MEPSFSDLSSMLSHLTEGEIQEVERAFHFAVRAHAPQQREDGTPYVYHVIEVAKILAGWKADADTIIAALLHDTIEDTGVTKEQLSSLFGRHVALLVDSVTKFTDADLSPNLPLDRKIETLRKLFDVMRLDVRSILIKLADRIHNIRTIHFLPTPERRRRFAEETLEVYYKIAVHLGMREVRHIFAEYAVPEAYDDGNQACAEWWSFLDEAASISRDMLEAIRGTGAQPLSVAAEPRNLSAFYDRRRRRGGVAQSIDAYFISIQVPTEEGCYQMLRLIHTLYRPLSTYFRDYIAIPSDPGYQSLHTAITLPDGRIAEVRVRTPTMQRQALLGVPLWLFGGGTAVPPNFEWIQRTGDLDLRTRDSSTAFWDALQADIFSEKISVSVGNHRFALPRGATVLDAAYAAHDEKAGYVTSATIRGIPVPLQRTLQEDDDIHFVTADDIQTEFLWLQMVVTHHAKLLIIDVLKKLDRSKKIEVGQSLLQREFDYYGKGLVSDVHESSWKLLLEALHRAAIEDVFVLVGEGVLKPRDVVFQLFPLQDGHRSFPLLKRNGRFPFRLHVELAEQPGGDVLSLFQGLVHVAGVQIHRTMMMSIPHTKTIDISIVGSSLDRLQFADFLDLLERQEWTTKIDVLLSSSQKTFLVGSAVLGFLITVIDILWFPFYAPFLQTLPFGSIASQIIPFIPILFVNTFLLGLARRFIARMRTEQWFLGMGLLLNIFGISILAIRMTMYSHVYRSLFPLIATFAVSLFYIGIRFYQADKLLYAARAVHRIQRADPPRTRHQLAVGYAIRILAVAIWGILPLYIRYSPVSDVSPLIRIFYTCLGVLLPFSLLYFLRKMKRRSLSLRSIRYTYSFWIFLVGQIGYTYLQNLSLLYTSGTNLLLFNSYAPVILFFLAAIFWRQHVPYLRQPDTMVWMFLLSILSAFGSSLLIYSNTTIDVADTTFTGDMLAILSTFFDVVTVLGQVQFIRQFPRTDGVLLNLHMFFYFFLSSIGLLLLSSMFGVVHFSQLFALKPALWSMGAGLFLGIGLFCNYEAFKRIDGYIAYILFNLSAVVTFVFEAFILHAVSISSFLILSAGCTIFASIIAERINSRCEKEGV